MPYYSIGVGLGIAGGTIAAMYLAKKCIDRKEEVSNLVGIAKDMFISSDHSGPIEFPHASNLLQQFRPLNPSFPLTKLFNIAYDKGWINEDSYFQYQKKYGFCVSGGSGKVYILDPTTDQEEIDGKIKKVVSWGIFPNFSPYMLIKYTLNASSAKIVSLSENISKKIFAIGDDSDCFTTNGVFSLENPNSFKNLKSLLKEGVIVNGSLTPSKED